MKRAMVVVLLTLAWSIGFAGVSISPAATTSLGAGGRLTAGVNKKDTLLPLGNNNHGRCDAIGDNRKDVRARTYFSPQALAEHYFPQQIWFHPFESCAWPAAPGNPGVAVYRVRPHPEDPSMLSITYAILYRHDCGGFLGIDSHPGDVESFSYTLVQDPDCTMGWRLFSVKTTAHGGAPRNVGVRILNTCDPLPELYVSHKKHGTYVTIEDCNRTIDPTQSCYEGYTTDFVLVNAGDPESPLADDLSAYIPSEPGAPPEYIWSGDGRFCGGQQAADRRDCVSAPGSKLVDDGLLAPTRKDGAVLIGMGDSMTHGTMDATNNAVNTVNAYLQKVNDSLAPVIPFYLTQPFFNFQEDRIEPFIIPSNLGVDGSDIYSIEGLNYYKRAGTPETLESEALISDHLLPSRLRDKYDKVLYPINLFAGKPVSILDAAVWLLNKGLPKAGIDKALVVFWSGNNDSSNAALGSGGNKPTYLPLPFAVIASELKPGLRQLMGFGALSGEISFAPYTHNAIERGLTDLQDFSEQYNHVINRLLTETAESGVQAEIFISTLPYYSAVGYLMDSEDIEFYLRKIAPEYRVPGSFKRVAPPGGPIVDSLKGDRISLLTFGMMYVLLSTGHSVTEVNRTLETFGSQRDGMVLSEEEQLCIMGRIDEYNQVIKAAAAAAGPHVHLVDIGQFLNDVFLGRQEVIVNGKALTRKWVRGGGFCLDGVHPGYTGHALVANLVLEKINHVLGMNALPYDLGVVQGTDPYFDADQDGFCPGVDYDASGLTRVLFLLRDPDDADPAVQPVLPPNVWDLISDAVLGEILHVPAVKAEALRQGIVSDDASPEAEEGLFY